jgi:putative membrane protein
LTTTDFYTPQRQNFRGIIVIFLMDLVKRIRQNVYALLPLLSSNIRNNYLNFVILGFVVLLLLQLLYSYKSYLNFQFHIEGHRFFLRHGVFKFTDTDIPFDRIQNININQNLIQQMMNVVGFEIETAGQGSAEIKIKALSREDAKALKQILLKNKTDQISDTQSETTAKESVSDASPEKVFKLDLGRLLKVGLSANYLKGFGLVFVFIMTLFQYAEDIFMNLYDVDVTNAYADKVSTSFSFMVALFVLIILASFLVTVVSTIIRYFELKITKINNNFEVEYGLFKRINQVIKKSKTQVFELETNPIKDLFGIKSVFISQASSEELNDKKKIGLVGLSGNEVGLLFESLFDLNYKQDFILSKSSMRLMFRLLTGYTIICIAIGLGLYFWLGLTYIVLLPILLLSLLIFVAYKKVKKSYVGINNNLVMIHSGSIHTNLKYISTHKIQSLALKRNVFQQRNKHADLIIYTASGSERVNYIKLEDVLKIINFLNYKVESSSMSWI